MDDSQLHSWFREAARAAPEAPPMPADFPARIRRLHQRRRRQRATVCGAVLVLLGSSLGWWLHQRGLHEVGGQQPVMAKSKVAPGLKMDAAAIARLDAEAESLANVARQLVQLAEQRHCMDALQAELAGVDPFERVERDLDESARLLVNHANRLEHELGFHTAAAAQYRRVIELFSASLWAQIAQQKLVKLNAG